MSTRQIPTRTDSQWYDLNVDLDGVSYVLEFYWNTVDASWYMTVKDKDESVLLAERKLVIGIPILSRFRDIRLPPGEFMVQDTTGAQIEAGVAELGGRVVLLYMEQATLPASFSIAP